jgi:hypothetical protein
MRAHTEDAIARTVAELAPVLAKLVRVMVREELAAAAGGEADPWVKHTDWPCASRRAACSLARSGDLEGVRRVGAGRGSLFLVRRSVLDAWIERETTKTSGAPPADDFAAAMARSGLRPGTAKASPKRAGRAGR